MPKVIKSGAIKEERSPLVLELPLVADHVPAARTAKEEADFLNSVFAVPDKDKDKSNDYSKYFLHISEGDTVNKEEISKYYSNIKDIDAFDDSGDRKYFYREPEDDLPKNEENIEEYGLEAVEEKPAVDFYDEKNLSTAEMAELKARKIIAEAMQEAETMRMKLAAEVSEAEVKKELAKSFVAGLVEEAEKSAAEIVEKAKAQALQTIEEAKKDGQSAGYQAGLEEGKKEGYAKGLEEGNKEGYEKGLGEGTVAGQKEGRAAGFNSVREEMAKKLTEATQKAKEILVGAEKERDATIASANDQIIKIVMAVVNKVLNKEIEENPFLVLPIVKEAAKKVADQPRLFITVSPSNYELVQMAQGDIKKMLGGKQEFTIVSDATMGPADVIIGTGGSGDVDARLETQLNEIRKTIEMVMRQ